MFGVFGSDKTSTESKLKIWDDASKLKSMVDDVVKIYDSNSLICECTTVINTLLARLVKQPITTARLDNFAKCLPILCSYGTATDNLKKTTVLLLEELHSLLFDNILGLSNLEICNFKKELELAGFSYHCSIDYEYRNILKDLNEIAKNPTKSLYINLLFNIETVKKTTSTALSYNNRYKPFTETINKMYISVIKYLMENNEL